MMYSAVSQDAGDREERKVGCGVKKISAKNVEVDFLLKMHSDCPPPRGCYSGSTLTGRVECSKCTRQAFGDNEVNTRVVRFHPDVQSILYVVRLVGVGLILLRQSIHSRRIRSNLSR